MTNKEIIYITNAKVTTLRVTRFFFMWTCFVIGIACGVSL